MFGCNGGVYMVVMKDAWLPQARHTGCVCCIVLKCCKCRGSNVQQPLCRLNASITPASRSISLSTACFAEQAAVQACQAVHASLQPLYMQQHCTEDALPAMQQCFAEHRLVMASYIT